MDTFIENIRKIKKSMRNKVSSLFKIFTFTNVHQSKKLLISITKYTLKTLSFYFRFHNFSRCLEIYLNENKVL